jgi:hypothetical protein
VEKSTHEAQLALAANLAQGFIGGSGRDGLSDPEDPDPLFLVQAYASPAGTEDDAVFGAFEFGGITRAKLHYIADRLGENDAAGFVEGEGGGHGWHYIVVIGIGKCH